MNGGVGRKDWRDSGKFQESLPSTAHTVIWVAVNKVNTTSYTKNHIMVADVYESTGQRVVALDDVRPDSRSEAGLPFMDELKW